jgi:predicted nucleic acid-binding protein
MILVDSNVPLDVVTQDPVWSAWSAATMKSLARTDQLLINPIIYAELSITFSSIADLETNVRRMQLKMAEIPREAAFRAGKAFLRYRRLGGTKGNVLPDFFVGAHAMTIGASLLTRDANRYRTYFPAVTLITP